MRRGRATTAVEPEGEALNLSQQYTHEGNLFGPGIVHVTDERVAKDLRDAEQRYQETLPKSDEGEEE